ncbi:HNH endonuclease signature motif containing protein [Kribbella kalugense]|uniref:Uncharacterized protein DUF222 n=1 Tax=Kribbella kalugense TaxID=2512221 RepID=A0A4R7ZJM3_9ACTN|nr:HNH endonuclease signature motif containing protein [Kribbella kalugense]TDW15300.1 uncharacterized protein DUF222 [Kribbella kalugense]
MLDAELDELLGGHRFSRVDALEWELWDGVEQDEAERAMLRREAPRWVFLKPGGDLATALEDTRPQAMSPTALIELMKAADRLTGWSESIKATAIASFIRQRRAEHQDSPRPTQLDAKGRPIDPERSWYSEIALALGLSPDTVGRRAETALRLTSTLSATHSALRCGALTWGKALAISEATRTLPDDAAQAVEAHVLKRAASQTHRNLRESLRRQVAKHTAPQAAEDHRAAAADRTCKIVPLSDGMAGLWIVHTADKIQQIWIAIQAMTTLAKRATPTAPQTPEPTNSPIPETTPQTPEPTNSPTPETTLHHHNPPPQNNPSRDDNPSRPGTPPPAADPPRAPSRPHRTDATLHRDPTHQDESTAAPATADAAAAATASAANCDVPDARALDANPASAGPGAADRGAADVGDLDTDTSDAGAVDRGAEKDTRTAEQRRADVAADLFEHILHNGVDWLGRRLPDQHRRRPHIEVVVPASTLLGLDDDPAELTGYGPIPAEMARRIAADGTWRRLLTDPINGAVLEASTTRHDPGSLVTETLLARHPVCAWPGCNRTSRDCDRDHLTPFAQSGRTSLSGMAPYCEYHHVIKDTPAWGWTTTSHPDGSITLVTPTGHRHTTVPPARGPITQQTNTSPPTQQSPTTQQPTTDPTADPKQTAHDPPPF